MRGEFGPGEVYNRRVTKHLRSLLPDRTVPEEQYTFGGRTVLDDETNPGRPAGGTCQIKAYVGVDGQVTVLEKSAVQSGDETLWACRNLLQRTHEVDARSMEPFTYHVQTSIQRSGGAKSNERTIKLEELTADPVYGGREAQAALLLAERIAVEKQRHRHSAGTSCCSLTDLPSFPRVVGQGWLGLDWGDVARLLGPDADTIAANATVGEVEPDERKAAKEKGLEIFTPEEPLSERIDRHRPASPPQQRSDATDRFATELPEGMSPDEAEQKLSEMEAQIREMKRRF
jgi:hypothetical protein